MATEQDKPRVYYTWEGLIGSPDEEKRMRDAFDAWMKSREGRMTYKVYLKTDMYDPVVVAGVDRFVTSDFLEFRDANDGIIAAFKEWVYFERQPE